MSRINLRQLARRYAEGALDQQAYRQARAEYIEAALAGDDNVGSLTQASYTSPPAIVGEETITAARLQQEREQTQMLFGNASAQNPTHLQTQPIQLTDRSQPSVALMAGAIAVVLTIGIIAMMLLGDGDDSPGAAPAQSQSMQPLSAEGGNAALVQLKVFLAAPQWDQQSLDSFVSEWQNLSSQDRDSALQSMQARQLGDVLYRQLLEERALDGLTDSAADKRSGQDKIIKFARDIGVDDRRLQSDGDSQPDAMHGSGGLEWRRIT